MKNTWEFVEKYYPNYSSCNIIAECNDLQKILDGEINGCAKVLYDNLAYDQAVEWSLEIDEVHFFVLDIVRSMYYTCIAGIYEKAIEEFLKQ